MMTYLSKPRRTNPQVRLFWLTEKAWRSAHNDCHIINLCPGCRQTNVRRAWRRHSNTNFMSKAEELLREMFKQDPVKAIQCTLLLIGENLIEANADYMNISQKMEIKGQRVSISAKFKIKDITPITAP